jgi:hypothetical protein
MENPFADLIPSSPASDPGFAGYIPGTPKPEKPGETLNNQGQAYTNQSKPIYDRATAIDKARDGYRNDKRVLKYESAIDIYASALTSPNTPEADNLLINAIAKIGDPITGVNQREGESYEQASPTIEQWKARLAKEFGTDGAGNFTPQARTRIKEAIRNRMSMIGDQYRLARQDHSNYIKSLGIPDADPETIIGPSAGEPYKRFEAEYLSSLKPKLTEAEITAELEKRVRTGTNPDETIQWLASIGRPPSKEEEAEIRRAQGNKRAIALPAEKREPEAGSSIVRDIQLGLGGLAEGAGDVVGLVANPLNAGINWIAGKEILSTDVGRDLRADLGLPMPSNNRERVADEVNKFAGGGLGLSSVARRAAPYASGVVSKGLEAFGANPFRDAAAGGAAGGAGELTRQAGGGPVLQTVASLAAGGGTALANPSVLRGLATRGSVADPALMRASEAENVGLIRPMVDPGSRAAAGAAESRPLTQPIIRQGVQAVEDKIEKRVGQLGAGGTEMELGAAGSKIQSAAQNFITRSKGVADRLYARARSLSGDTRFPPAEALRRADETIATLEANGNTNAGELAFLRGLRDDLAANGGKTIDELRELRRSIRGRVNEQNLTATPAESRAINILDGTHADARANLPSGAASAFQRADTYYRERMVHIDDVLERFLGGNVEKGQPRLSGEEAFRRLKSMASPGGDGRRLAAMMRNLDPQERLDISATIAESLGRDAPDMPFTLGKFLAQSKQLSPSAQRTIFGPAGAESIKNLRLLSRSLLDAQGDVNWSRSGTTLTRTMGNQAKALVLSLAGVGGASVSGGSALAGFGAVAGAATIGGAYGGIRSLSARAMMSPRVTKWLYDTSNVSTPGQAREAARRLGVIISREPALASELEPVRRALNDNLTTSRAAASEGPGPEEDDNGR